MLWASSPSDLHPPGKMRNSFGYYLVQYLLFIFNVVFLLAGLNLLGMSVWALLDKVRWLVCISLFAGKTKHGLAIPGFISLSPLCRTIWLFSLKLVCLPRPPLSYFASAFSSSLSRFLDVLVIETQWLVETRLFTRRVLLDRVSSACKITATEQQQQQHSFFPTPKHRVYQRYPMDFDFVLPLAFTRALCPFGRRHLHVSLSSLHISPIRKYNAVVHEKQLYLQTGGESDWDSARVERKIQVFSIEKQNFLHNNTLIVS